MMRYRFLSFCLAGILIPCVMHARCQQKTVDSAISNIKTNGKVYSFKDIKKKQKELKGFQFIQGGTFSTVKPDKGIDRRPENDTSLIIDLEPGKRLTVSSFFMSEKEVTNLEYRTFVNWVIDSIALIQEFISSVHSEPNFKFEKVRTAKPYFKCICCSV